MATGPGKDIWDKIAALSIPFATLVVGLVGSYATFTYNRADLRAKEEQHNADVELQNKQAESDRAFRKQQQEDSRQTNREQMLEHLFAYVSSPDPVKREFGYSMYAAIGEQDLATKLIEVKRDKAGIGVLKALAKDADPNVSAAATRSLASLENAISAPGVTMRARSSCRDFASAGFRTEKVEKADWDYPALAKRLGVEQAAVSALVYVEIQGARDQAGRPSVLFDRQKFRDLTNGQYDKTHPNISSPDPGGYDSIDEYRRLTEAAHLNCPAALAATKWGTFHIPGSLYRQLGYSNVDDYIKDLISSDLKELESFIELLKSRNIITYLREKNWDKVAKELHGEDGREKQYARDIASVYAFYAN